MNTETLSNTDTKFSNYSDDGDMEQAEYNGEDSMPHENEDLSRRYLTVVQGIWITVGMFLAILTPAISSYVQLVRLEERVINQAVLLQTHAATPAHEEQRSLNRDFIERLTRIEENQKRLLEAILKGK